MRIKITVEIEDDGGEIVDRLCRAIEGMGKPLELPKPPLRRIEDTPPAFNHAPPRRRTNGHRQ